MQAIDGSQSAFVSKEKLVAKDKTDETENAGSTEEPPPVLAFRLTTLFRSLFVVAWTAQNWTDTRGLEWNHGQSAADSTRHLRAVTWIFAFFL